MSRNETYTVTYRITEWGEEVQRTREFSTEAAARNWLYEWTRRGGAGTLGVINSDRDGWAPLSVNRKEANG